MSIDGFSKGELEHHLKKTWYRLCFPPAQIDADFEQISKQMVKSHMGPHLTTEGWRERVVDSSWKWLRVCQLDTSCWICKELTLRRTQSTSICALVDHWSTNALGSWGPTFKRIKLSAIAWEIPTPSFGAVPRPSSSIKTNEFEDATPDQKWLRCIAIDDNIENDKPKIIAEDAISLANVLKLFSISSSFESLVSKESWILPIQRIRETEEYCTGRIHRKLAYSAGTKHPHIAIMVRRPIWRR